ncbi:hypothetical protein [Achromobacter arsenitoxydans]|uniref:Phage protein n=1 Tax=Achromobacter arsenitoxydans SY8 TaxID=477184 RepID=H0FAE3_9BURK|nr:hypothetical protein [Achromobacter arsenitoxydans]EHK64774.1 phage protein [Achromobacter arsenitoxydans SY8]
MKVIKPVSIGRDQLISSSVAEDDYPAYVPTTDYPVGARVVYQAQVFECVQTPNVGNTPGAAPLYWALAGPTNRWAMYDSEVSTQTVGDSPLRVVVRPGLVNSLALLELVGTRVKVIGRDGLGGPILYETERALEGSIVTNWYEYFFEPFSPLSELVLTDLPAYGSLHLDVSILAPGAEVACGAMICGTSYFIGDAEYGGSVGIVDYSRKDTSETGVTTFRRRRFSRRMSTRLWLETARFAAVYRLLSGLRATPCVWIGTDAEAYGPLTIYGFYKDFSIDVAYEMMNFCNLEIEGLT